MLEDVVTGLAETLVRRSLQQAIKDASAQRDLEAEKQKNLERGLSLLLIVARF